MNLRIAFQGIKGAYSEDACNKLFGDSETLPCHDFYELFFAGLEQKENKNLNE